GNVAVHPGRHLPGTYVKSGGSAGGFGPGAAFGAKLGAPDRDVVLTSGDGFFMFGTPEIAMWSAAHHKTPFLSVVMVNRSYGTGTSVLARQYPEGAAISAGEIGRVSCREGV